MQEVLIVGNPNCGKTTLFNSLTKSEAHTGNWHGVTVEAKEKVVKFDGEEFKFVDLPGLYSLETFSFEEEVAKEKILSSKKAVVLYVADANSLLRNLYLCKELIDKQINLKILINNYDYFEKQGGRIDIKKLSQNLGVECIIINAQKIKLNKKLLQFDFNKNESVKNNIINNKNNRYDKNNLENIIINNYKCLNDGVLPCINKNKNYIYGKNKFDNILLNKYLFLPIFLIIIISTLFFVFYLIGPILSQLFLKIINISIKQPFMFLLGKITSTEWVIKLFENGVFSAGFTVASFLPQICVLYFFLSLLEDTGIMSRFAFMLDDFFSKFGLSGKSAYTMLMGFGCSTTATLTAKNMPNKKAQVKTALLTPYMSCSAKLPVYAVIAGAIFGAKSIIVIIGLYFLGIVLSLLLALMFEKSILKSENNDFLLEFPALRFPRVSKMFKQAFINAKQFLTRVFSIIFCVSIIIWILNNFGFAFRYIPQSENTMLNIICRFVSPIFIPIGLSSPAIVSCLVVGLIAKELILSNIAISNCVASSVSAISASLLLSSSPVHFSLASGLSFLVFVLLYAPCISNIAVLYKEIGKKYATIGIIIQFICAYLFSMLIYQLFNNLLLSIFAQFAIVILFYLFIKIFSKEKIKIYYNDCRRNCLNCTKCP